MSLVQLRLEDEGRIARLSLNRPEVLNAIDVPLARALNEQVQALARHDGLRCVVLEGAGRAFAAGGDLGRFAEDFDRTGTVVDELLDALHPAILALQALDLPVLAAVQGAVAGAGLSLMAGCDLVVAAEGTRFVTAYDRVGASPDCGGTWWLPRLLGPRRAAQFYLLGETLDATQALSLGLVNRVVPAAELGAQSDAWARLLAAGPTRAFGHFRRLIRQAGQATLAEQMEAERAAFGAATRTQDFREGVSAFLSKRPPRFAGR
jgi:2-(1,2-epoxy-1,2-dihydrophenyl)acetyl-CoA isomerase